VLYKGLVPQMGSAGTFARKVVELLRGINQRKGKNVQVFLPAIV